MKFVISSGLAGAAAWSVDLDDFRGLCGSPFPILSAISTTLNGMEHRITYEYIRSISRAQKISALK